MLIPQVDTNVDLSFGLDLVGIDVSSHDSFHLHSSLTHYTLYPDLFDDFATPMIFLNTLDIYPTGFDCKQVYEGGVS